ncbi:hypothetical protein CANTEDRAFT_133335 [Yamadazyma tenuis ATCC 10573]|uniref:RRM domain-containing protein n=1 Tax=Candida tenuis (strain ATCC 10573 / BCRC 21748 / CBS 615 / JCM 9827 / NBRC 10315 / NRRL Y-1498 / VKM Y-70) TaxID=590646 RepID=G3AYR1_CANTC|nr:uncharacterized protein CANTEDRAFT_133335 [Yamadazyma tenuis ATCC 10573]EGV65907.1 hypothetical protein CANTEDRAFT_133335 [Yamadazyma tenuis ATCC 10573]
MNSLVQLSGKRHSVGPSSTNKSHNHMVDKVSTECVGNVSDPEEAVSAVSGLSSSTSTKANISETSAKTSTTEMSVGKDRWSFNKDAQPFFPTPSSPSTPSTSLDEPLPIVVMISNIVPTVVESDLEALLMETLSSSKIRDQEYIDPDFNILSFGNTNSFDEITALVEIFEYQEAETIMEKLQGKQWLNSTLEVAIMPPPSLSPSPYYGFGFFNQMMYFPGIAPYGVYGSPYGFSGRQAMMPPFGSVPPWRKAQPSVPMAQPPRTPGGASRRSSSSSTGSASKPTGVPQFVMNFVKKEEPIHNSDFSDQESSQFIDVNDDDGNPIKVNACRLFVGNVPFSSTWSRLRNFLVTKSQELETSTSIDILRVEIPMHSPKDHKEEFTRTMSRGFAIVTTGNRISSELIIKHFDGIEFEGRNLTVRFDKFPEFSNYILQQLYSGHNKDKALTSLAFERNSIQQKFYYGNGYQGYSNFPSRSHSFSHRSSNPQHNSSSPRFPILQPNFVPQVHPSVRYTTNLNIPRSIKPKQDAEPLDDLNEDEKARELVNSFKSLGISS